MSQSPDPAGHGPRGPGAALRHIAGAYGPGLALVFTVAGASTFISEHYGAPVMLFALLIGMAFHFVLDEPRWGPGVDFAASRLLRLGVALLGARVTWDQIMSLGPAPLIAVPLLVVATLGSGLLFARLMNKTPMFGLLTAGAVAICGASAALAMAAVLPARGRTDSDTLFTVIAVTTLSTLAMILYPILYGALGFTDPQIGLLLGVTIHDVAQVVGAGYIVSEEAGDIATFVKLLRVAMLPVVIVGLAIWFRRRESGEGAAASQFPWFAVGFALILVLNSAGAIPGPVLAGFESASQWLLVAAISALGIKTSLKAMAGLGAKHILVVVSETLFLLIAAVLVLKFAF